MDAPSGTEPTAASTEFDYVTEDAIKHGAAIPPSHLPQDQRRAYLGGWFTAERGGLPNTPYTDPGCVDAWHAGFKRAKRESSRA